jgi:uncharacterized cupin superfamily protein
MEPDMPKFDLAQVPPVSSTGYPGEFARAVAGRLSQRLTGPLGLSDFGVQIITLQPGAWSSQRHWHEAEDEFLMMLEGEAMLVEDEGEMPIRAGECAMFLKAVPNGHHLINRGQTPVKFLVVGAKGSNGDCHYPDIDLVADFASGRYTRKDGTPY